MHVLKKLIFLYNEILMSEFAALRICQSYHNGTKWKKVMNKVTWIICCYFDVIQENYKQYF